MCLAREKRSEYIDEIREGTSASDANYESHFSPYLSRNAPPYLQDHACEAKNPEKILSGFGIREG